MSNIKVEFKNKARILAVMKSAPNDLAKAIQKALEQAGGETVGKVKQVIYTGRNMWKAPVDTGKMVQNINISEKTPLKIVITPAMGITPYALFVHQGTGRMKARPYFEITKATEQKNIQSFFSRTLDNFVKDLARRMG
jgi:HK97 gp10 family phage protein